MRHLTVRDYSGTKVYGDFTPPSRGGEPFEAPCLELAWACYREHMADGASIWSAYEPVITHKGE